MIAPLAYAASHTEDGDEWPTITSHASWGHASAWSRREIPQVTGLRHDQPLPVAPAKNSNLRPRTDGLPLHPYDHLDHQLPAPNQRLTPFPCPERPAGGTSRKCRTPSIGEAPVGGSSVIGRDGGVSERALSDLPRRAAADVRSDSNKGPLDHWVSFAYCRRQYEHIAATDLFGVAPPMAVPGVLGVAIAVSAARGPAPCIFAISMNPGRASP